MTETLLKVSLHELCQIERVERHTIIQIVEYEIAKPIEGEDIAEWVFDATSVHWIKKAVRLQQDLDIDWVAVAMMIDLLQQKEILQRDNEHYQQQLARFLS